MMAAIPGWAPWLLTVAFGAAAMFLFVLWRRACVRSGNLELRRRELSGMLETMHIAVLSVDADGVVRHANAAARALLGITRDSAAGSSLRELGVDGTVCAFVAEALQQGAPRREERALRSDPPVELILLAEPVHGGGSGDLVVVLDDVTRLRQLESMRSDFAANVSHELRTPITAIQGYAELLVEDARTPDHAQVILRNARRLSNIIEDLLALARLEDPTHAATLVHESLAVHELLDAVVRAAAEEAQREGITVKVRCGDYLVCRGSRPLLEQAIGNLLTNAIRYGGSGEDVVLEAALVDGSKAAISVIDHGPGIDPEHHDRVFERFYRVDRGRSRQVGGTGLGLAIVKHIALVHGGAVELTSTPGGGCTFNLRLPLETN